MDTLLVERDPARPALMTIILNRPEKLNAINTRMHEELLEVCRALETDHRTRVVIITGAGRAFSSGADIAAARPPSSGDPLEERVRAGAGNRSCAALEGLDQVTIGAINGLTIGGAVAFAACMDIRLAAESAWFSIPEVDLDIPLTWNTLPRLVREIGPARTKELVMTCDRFSSADALAWGFVNHVVPDGELMARATGLAGKLLTKDPMSIALTKSTVNAISRVMTPEHVTHGDREYLMNRRGERTRGPSAG